MNFKSNTLLLSMLILLVFDIRAQSQVTIPKEFIETSPPPVVGSNEWHQLNHSSNEFGVKVIDGKLEIKKVDEINRCELTVTNGKLVGINRGEWGGTLTFVPTDSIKNTVAIKRGNIKFIFTSNDKIYFIEGLAHGASSKGAIFELDTIENKFSYTKLVDFEDAPMAFTLYQDKLLVATFENFYVVKDFEKELIFQDTFWSCLYPNSIAILDDKNVFLGIRGGIVKLDLTVKTLTFYEYEE